MKKNMNTLKKILICMKVFILKYVVMGNVEIKIRVKKNAKNYIYVSLKVNDGHIQKRMEILLIYVGNVIMSLKNLKSSPSLFISVIASLWSRPLAAIAFSVFVH